MEEDQKRNPACDFCKNKKLRCEWEQGHTCVRYSQTGTVCVLPPKHVRKKREKKPNDYLSSLEVRLERMEVALKNAALHGAGRPSEELQAETVIDKMPVLKIGADRSSVFFGSSSGFSIFSPQGLKWITEKIGDDKFATFIDNMPRPTNENEHILGPSLSHLMSTEDCGALPARDIAISYINTFFRGFGTIMPLFDETAFKARLFSQYPISRSDDIAWWACVNTVFAITSIGEELNSSSTVESLKPSIARKFQDRKWWKWFKNACSSFVELQFQEGSLPGVQAMVGIAFLLQTLPDPYPCMVVAGIALRMAQTMGIHRNLVHSGLSASELEQRRHAFWTALIIERGVNFRMGRPSVVHEDDIGIDLPKPDKSMLYASHLRDMAKISLMQGRIYNKLYSAKSLSQSTSERLHWIGMLDDELQQWRQGVPAAFRPGNRMPPNLSVRDVACISLMHFSYFNALITIHRVSNHLGPWTDTSVIPVNHDSDDDRINPRVYSGGAICANAARSIISQLNHCTQVIESGAFNVFGIMAYYPLTASLMLFATILENPGGSWAMQDVERMESVVAFLLRVYGDETSTESIFLRKTFGEANKLAREHVTKAQLHGNQGIKRGRDGADLMGSRLAKGEGGLFASYSASVSNLPDNTLENLCDSIDQLKNSPTISNNSGLDSILPSTIAPSDLQDPPQRYMGPYRQSQNDLPLETSSYYGNDKLSNQNQTQLTGLDNFFMLQDENWVFSLLNQSVFKH